jgi:hypothetical protein
MNYPDGQEVRLGDRVRLGQDDSGIVVASIDTGDYNAEHPQAQWGYLKTGVLIKFSQWGLIHYERPESDLQLVGRALEAT